MKRAYSVQPTPSLTVKREPVALSWWSALAFAIVILNLYGVRFQSAPLTLFVPVIGLTGLSLPLLLMLRRLPLNLRLLCSYFVAFTLFMHLRCFADDTSIPVQMDYVIYMERALFGGIIPTTWLQAHLYHGVWGPLEIISVATHTSYFFMPYAVALWLWRFHPQTMARYVVALMGTLGLGLVIYYLLPTVPPWMAAEAGKINLHRVIFELLTLPPSIDPNPVAAMPSLHTGLTTVVALALGRAHRIGRPLGVGYVLLMGFSLVYLGEHYVVDLLAGLIIALLAWRMASRVERLNPD